MKLLVISVFLFWSTFLGAQTFNTSELVKIFESDLSETEDILIKKGYVFKSASIENDCKRKYWKLKNPNKKWAFSVHDCDGIKHITWYLTEAEAMVSFKENAKAAGFKFI